ncbi:hypothetical protein [Streptomyces sp. DI166]|nr:hypothetical protein [Streptomyces sp. DI166]
MTRTCSSPLGEGSARTEGGASLATAEDEGEGEGEEDPRSSPKD